jgi:hypothetical protein
MDWKELLQEGGVVLVVALMVYGSGWQYCLGLSHALGGTVYFVVPWDAGLGTGFPGLITIATVSGLGYLAGYAARYLRERRNWGVRVHLVAVILCLLGYFLSTIGELLGIPSIAAELPRAQWRFMAALIMTLLFSYVVAFGRLRRPTGPTQYFIYAGLLFSFVCATFYYSTLLGRAAAARTVALQEHRAEIVFADTEMERDYGKMLFIPIMEKGDDLVVVRCAVQQPGTACKEMVIKKALIKSVNFQ